MLSEINVCANSWTAKAVQLLGRLSSGLVVVLCYFKAYIIKQAVVFDFFCLLKQNDENSMLFVFEVLVGQSFGSLCTLQGAQLGVFKATESHRGLVFHSLPQFSFSHNTRTQHHLHQLTNQLRGSGRQEILLIRSSHFTLSYVHSATWQTTRYVLSAHQLNNKLIFSHKKKQSLCSLWLFQA